MKIGRKTVKVFYDWSRIKELQEILGKDFEQQIGMACLEMDLEILSQALSAGTGIPKEEIVKASPPIVETITVLTNALNLAFHGTETPKETFRESLAIKWKTFWNWLKPRRTATA